MRSLGNYNCYQYITYVLLCYKYFLFLVNVRFIEKLTIFIARCFPKFA